MKRKSQPCIARCADGSPCGRRAKLPEQFCSMHQHLGNGRRPSNGFRPRKRTPEEIIEDLLQSKDPQVQLRALDLWAKRFDGQTTSYGPSSDYTALFAKATEEEKEEIKFHLDMFQAVKEKIYDRHPELPVDELTLNRRSARASEAAVQALRDQTKADAAECAAAIPTQPVTPEPVADDLTEEQIDALSDDAFAALFGEDGDQ